MSTIHMLVKNYLTVFADNGTYRHRSCGKIHLSMEEIVFIIKAIFFFKFDLFLPLGKLIVTIAYC
jgi:hypothetical protein